MKEQWKRTAMLLGEAGIARLAAAHVAVFGIGGVGGYAVEALARAGVGHFTLVDADTVSESNINRQIIATHKTVGMKKTAAAAARIREINPEAEITETELFFLPETADAVDFSAFDYVVDAVDTDSAKMELIRRSNAAGVPIICAMGTGNKLDPTAPCVTDIHKTVGCPLARTVRGLCRREGIKKLRVVYSTEEPKRVTLPEENGRHAPGSSPFVPAAAGLILAAEVVKELCREK
jgi:tRNA A37 threonylcarbamoyladenosine dehydratase